MKGTLGSVVGAVLLGLVGCAFWLDGMLERRMAIAQEDLAALDFVDPENEYANLQHYVEYGARIPWIVDGPLKEIRGRRASLQYWQAHYDELAGMNQVKVGEQEVDPDLQFLVANAMYRTMQRGPQDKPTVLKALDGTIRAYGDAIRASTDSREAAFNYEFVLRLRDEISTGKRKVLPGSGSREAGLGPMQSASIHGMPGAPPIEVKLDEFQIRIPVESREIDNSQNQAAGQGRIRKRRG